MESTFSKRLTQACDDNPLIPDYDHGRQVTIANKLEVSQEAVRKWFTGDSVPRSSFVDLYAIKDGQKIDFHVSVGREVKSDDGDISYEFIIPRQYSEINVLGLIYLNQGEIEWINMPTKLIDAHKETSEGAFKVSAKRDNGKYSTENDKWVRFRTIGDIL